VSSYQRLVVVSFKIEADLLAELDATARQLKMSRSELIRLAIIRYVKYYVRPSVTPRMTIYHDFSGNDVTTPRIRIR
jgi:metal-responsive CopG/Arc/MetJ family transcriptional regulator